MKFFVLSALIIFSFQLSAKKAPKWKDGNFKTTASGLQYKIVKEGKGDSVSESDSVIFEYVWYKKSDKKILFNSIKYSQHSGQEESLIIAEDAAISDGFKEGIKLLKENGWGYFKIPPSIGSRYREGEDTTLYFIHVCKVFHNYSKAVQVTSPNDSINIVINDPDKKYFGDTLFSLMKLAEAPQLVDCGHAKVMIAFKFELTSYNNGIQHKDILVFIECPDFYGKDYFVAGANYMVTCIPLYDDLKTGNRTMNSYSLEKLDRYYGLRVRKM